MLLFNSKDVRLPLS